MKQRQVFVAGVAGVMTLLGVACAPPSPTAVRLTPETPVDHQGALISADGSTVVSSVSKPNEIAVVDVETREYRRIAIDQLFSVQGISGDGRYALVLRISTDPVGVIMTRVDLDTEAMIDVFDPILAFDAQISDDGSVITRPGSDCTPESCTTAVDVWRDGVTSHVPVAVGSSYDQVLSPDGSHFISLVGDYFAPVPAQTLHSVDTATGEVTTITDNLPTAAIQNLDGTDESGSEIRVTDAERNAWSIGAGHAPEPRRSCGSMSANSYSWGVPSPNGAYCVEQVYVSGGGSKLQVVDLSTGSVRHIVSTDNATLSPRISSRPSVSDGGRTVYGYRLANEAGAALYIDG